MSEENFHFGQDAPPTPPAKLVEVEVPVGGYVERDSREVQTDGIPCVMCSSSALMFNGVCLECSPCDEEVLLRPSLEKTRVSTETQTDVEWKGKIEWKVPRLVVQKVI